MNDADVISELQEGNRLLKRERYALLGDNARLKEEVCKLKADKSPSVPLQAPESPVRA